MFLRLSRQCRLMQNINFRTFSSNDNLPNRRNSLALRGQSQMQTTLTTVHEDFTKGIRSAINPIQLLDTLTPKSSVIKRLPSDQLLQIIETLFGLQKANKDSVNRIDILSHPNFELLCRRLKRCCVSMDVNEVIVSLKIVNYLGVPANSEISLTLLNVLRHQINQLSLNQIVYTDFLLNQLQPQTKLQEAIKTALPMVFEIQLSTQMDKQNIAENISLLRYIATKNGEEFAVKTIDQILNALYMNYKKLSVDDKKQIIRSLCDLTKLPKNADRLFDKCIQQLYLTENISFGDLIEIAEILTKKCAKEPKFYSNQCKLFFDKCSRKLIESDLGLEQATYLQKHFKIISFINYGLLHYITDAINQNIAKWQSAPLDILFTIVQAFSVASYAPIDWNEKILPGLLANKELETIPENHSTWLQYALQLIVLNYFNQALIERVLSESYLTEFLKQNNVTVTDYLKILILYQEACTHKGFNQSAIHQKSIDQIINLYLQKQTTTPLRKALETELGEGFVLSNIRTKCGYFIQHVVKYSKTTNGFIAFKPIETDSMGLISLENIICDENEQLLAIDALQKHFYLANRNKLKGIFTLRQNHLKKFGVVVCEIKPQYWFHVPDSFDIRSTLLQDEIRKCLL